MRYDYKLKFEDEGQAKNVLDKALSNLRPWDYAVKVIGVHQEYEYDESDPEAEPTTTIYDGWHVDIVSRVSLTVPKKYIVVPKSPIHNFA